MAKYKVLERSFINNAIVEAGEIVEYDGEPSSNLAKLTKAEAKSADAAENEEAQG